MHEDEELDSLCMYYKGGRDFRFIADLPILLFIITIALGLIIYLGAQ